MAMVLVPLDGQRLAERALPLAAHLAQATGAELRLVHAASLPADDSLTVVWAELDQLEHGSKAYLASQAARVAGELELVATTALGYGPSAAFIVGEASAARASHIVMTTHGRAGLARAVLGSVAEQVLRTSPVPVLLLPAAAEAGREDRPIRHILLPMDGSVLSHAVIRPVAQLAATLGADVSLLRVYERGAAANEADLSDAVAELRHLRVEVRDVTVAGNEPATEILHMAGVLGIDAIAMATHGRSGLDRWAHGSVTEQVLRHSRLPLVTFGKVALRELLLQERREVSYA
jgi:nucleotide-binding universal stress UspA family protein